MTKTEIDIEGLKRIAAGDEKFVQEILSLYAKRTFTDIQELKLAAENSDWDLVQFLAHRMRSASVPLGAKKLLVILKKAELNLKNGKSEGIEALLESIYDEAESVIEAAKMELVTTSV